ncbi:sugar ABC transporter substrate-binding protein [Solirubrobacter sp. CPCC 204708]|uniref:Sugar ABC transporter substrate-binding protein n=1 Tax=Solirubrobacter deserti TaxID=2282478 RepID=A0ABT4RL20_9ACTN|nr:sugar ABC transporter substrate-binding protein [Solirubrobacter deserti]MBE2319019.1 sugar ABC transporter substrate-binding protein [Solirubrobacter deserti]MDA0139256.1 sugar ABC transporter substrate-binding protein [Solirubrobacter deserti]
MRKSLVALAAVLMLAGCGDNTSSTASDEGTATPAATEQAAQLPEKFQAGVEVALVRQLASGDFFQQWLLGAEEQAKALNIDLRISDARNNNDQHATDLQRAIDSKPDAIIVDHGLATTVNPLIDDAVKAGIPVVVFDVENDNPEVVEIQQSDEEAGTRIGEELVKGIGGEGEVGYVYVPGFAPLDRRNRGWDEVKKANSAIKEVAQFGEVSDSTANDTQEQANAVITANPELKAVLAPYDEFAKGVVNALEAANKTDVKVYGADISTPDIGVMTKEGSPWVATIATDPANVGRVAVRAAALKLNGDPIDTDVLVPPSLITQDFLRENSVKTLEDLRAKLPELNTQDTATADWIPKS